MNDNSLLINFFESQIASGKFRSQKMYRVALNNLKSYLMRRNGAESLASVSFLENWIVDMFFRSVNFRTCCFYLNLVSSLYASAVEAGMAEKDNSFSRVKKRLKEMGQEVWRSEISDKDLMAFRLFIHTPQLSQDTGEVVKSMLLFSLLCRCMPVSRIVSLRKDDIEGLPREAKTIALENLEPRHKFVFALSQSRLTDNQRDAMAATICNEYLRNHFIKVLGNVDITLRAYWALAAIRCGVSPAVVSAAVGPLPSVMPVLGIVEKTETDESEIEAAVNQVGEYFLDSSAGWFAMKLRRGVKFDAVKDLLEKTFPHCALPEFFYPTEEIATRVKGKIKFISKPVIRDIIFFKTQLPYADRIFRIIGKLAWGYKTNKTADSYTIIPDAAIEIFKTAIGHFTPGTSIGPAGTLELEEGEEIVVLAPPFKGFEGEVKEKIFNKKGVVYRISLFGDANDIEWKITNPEELSIIKKKKQQ